MSYFKKSPHKLWVGESPKRPPTAGLGGVQASGKVPALDPWSVEGWHLTAQDPEARERIEELLGLRAGVTNKKGLE